MCDNSHLHSAQDQEEEREHSSPPESGGVTIRTANKACVLHLEARPLPGECTTLLEKKTQLLKALNMLQNSTSKDRVKLNEDTIIELRELRTKLDSSLVASSSEWEGVVDHIWCFGPRHTGPNLLVNAVASYQRPSVWAALEGAPTRQALREHDNSIVSGFQLAMLSGPLCEEPMHGVCFFLKEWTQVTSSPPLPPAGGTDRETSPFKQPPLPPAGGTPEQPPLAPTGETDGDPEQPPTGGMDRGVSGGTERRGERAAATSDTYGPFSGQLISAMKEGCRRSFLAQPVRLMAAMYSSSILATADVLGKVYGVLGRRNGRVLADEMKEGSAIFSIQALVPVAESFGFAEEIRKRTSGLANPQLIFSHWEVTLSLLTVFVIVYCLFVVIRCFVCCLFVLHLFVCLLRLQMRWSAFLAVLR